MENQVVMQKKKGFRVVLFPLPYQGHLNPMLQLANILHSVGFTITIIHTKFNSPNHSNYPHFTFYSIPDDSLETKSDTGEVQTVVDLIASFNRNCQVPFRDCLARMISDDSKEPIACIITDAHWNCTQAVANSFNIRRIVLRTSSLSSFLVFAAHPLFREKGYLSISNQESEAPVVELPPLKLKDIPMIFTSKPDSLFKTIDNMIDGIKASSGLIWNSFSELEEPALQKSHQLMPVPTFTIGPFHKYFPSSNSSLLQQDQTSISWLNSQPPKSVLYVSFGSLAAMDKTEFMEMAWGLANSMQPFLWVVRPGMVRGSEWLELLPSGFMEGLGGRGHIVKWAPQQEVLAHPSTGGFWTHNGWNSTLESICEGVPMICSPCFGDQPVNARYVSEVWKVGVQLEKGLEREEIETTIRRLMVEREGAGMSEKIMGMKETVNTCLEQGGSSYRSLQSLVNYILSV